jgi:hypothetical protein
MNTASAEMGKQLVDCSKVMVVQGQWGASACAAVDIALGDMVEYGIVRRLGEGHGGLDGMKNEFVFTWSDNIPNHQWASASGAATFYDTAIPEETTKWLSRRTANHL